MNPQSQTISKVLDQLRRLIETCNQATLHRHRCHHLATQLVEVWTAVQTLPHPRLSGADYTAFCANAFPSLTLPTPSRADPHNLLPSGIRRDRRPSWLRLVCHLLGTIQRQLGPYTQTKQNSSHGNDLFEWWGMRIAWLVALHSSGMAKSPAANGLRDYWTRRSNDMAACGLPSDSVDRTLDMLWPHQVPLQDIRLADQVCPGLRPEDIFCLADVFFHVSSRTAARGSVASDDGSVDAWVAGDSHVGVQDDDVDPREISATWLALWGSTPVSVRIVPLYTLNHPTADVVLLYQQISARQKLGSSNHLAALYGICFDDSPSSRMFVVSEWAPNGSLQSKLQSPLSAEAALPFLKDILKALLFLQESGDSQCSTHGNLTPSNIMLFPDGCRLSDFAIHILPRRYQPCYTAPERYSDSFVAAAPSTCDVYSFGAIWYHALTANPPPPAAPHPAAKARPPLPSSVPLVVSMAIDLCLHKNPSSRPTLKSLFQLVGNLDDQAVIAEWKKAHEQAIGIPQEQTSQRTTPLKNPANNSTFQQRPQVAKSSSFSRFSNPSSPFSTWRTQANTQPPAAPSNTSIIDTQPTAQLSPKSHQSAPSVATPTKQLSFNLSNMGSSGQNMQDVHAVRKMDPAELGQFLLGIQIDSGLVEKLGSHSVDGATFVGIGPELFARHPYKFDSRVVGIIRDTQTKIKQFRSPTASPQESVSVAIKPTENTHQLSSAGNSIPENATSPRNAIIPKENRPTNETTTSIEGGGRIKSVNQLAKSFSDSRISVPKGGNAAPRSFSGTPNTGKLSPRADDTYAAADLDVPKDERYGLDKARSKTYICTASADLTSRIFDPANLQQKRLMMGHEAQVRSIQACQSGSSTTLATGCDDNVVRIWKREGSHPQHSLKGHTSSVSALAWLGGSERFLVSGGYDKNVHLWDIERGKEAGRISGHLAAIYSMTSIGSGHLATGCSVYNPVVRVWDINLARQTHELWGHMGNIYDLLLLGHAPFLQTLFSASGTHYLNQPDNIIRAWDLRTGNEAFDMQGHEGWVNCLARGPTPNTLYSGSSDQTVSLWDLRTRRRLAVMGPFSSPVTAISSDADVSIRQWLDSNPGLPLSSSSPATSHLISVATQDGFLRIYDVSSSGNPVVVKQARLHSERIWSTTFVESSFVR